MNPPIRYFGGKGILYKDIFEHFPSRTQYSIYIEPFGGSFSTGLHLPYRVPHEVYNDLDRNVYSLYHVLSDSEKFDKFRDKASLVYYSEELRKEFMESLKTDMLSEVERAFRFWYVNRTSFNGVGGFSTMVGYERRGVSKHISDFLSSVEDLEELHLRLRTVTVLNRDAFEVMKMYDSPDTFMYLDPPYSHETRGSTRYDVDMDEKGQRRLMSFCLESSSLLLLSGYDNDLYNSVLLPAGWRKVEIEGTRECLWMSYNKKERRSLI